MDEYHQLNIIINKFENSAIITSPAWVLLLNSNTIAFKTPPKRDARKIVKLKELLQTNSKILKLTKLSKKIK